VVKHFFCEDKYQPTPGALSYYLDNTHLNRYRDERFLSGAPGAKPVGPCERCNDKLFTCNAALAHACPGNPMINKDLFTDEEKRRDRAGLLTCPKTTRPCSHCGLLAESDFISGHEYQCREWTQMDRKTFRENMEYQRSCAVYHEAKRQRELDALAYELELEEQYGEEDEEDEEEEEETVTNAAHPVGDVEPPTSPPGVDEDEDEDGWNMEDMHAAIAASLAHH